MGLVIQIKNIDTSNNNAINKVEWAQVMRQFVDGSLNNDTDFTAEHVFCGMLRWQNVKCYVKCHCQMTDRRNYGGDWVHICSFRYRLGFSWLNKLKNLFSGFPIVNTVDLTKYPQTHLGDSGTYTVSFFPKCTYLLRVRRFLYTLRGLADSCQLDKCKSGSLPT